jgi:hypothetical protein
MPTIEGSWGQLGNKETDNICADMARFNLREICHEDGEFFNNEEVLNLDDAERLPRLSIMYDVLFSNVTYVYIIIF